MEFLQRNSTLERVGLGAGRVQLKRRLRSKLERLGLNKPIACTSNGSAKVFKHLVSMLLKSTKLERLDIIGIDISLSSAKLFSRGLSKCDAITSIDLCGCNMKDEGLNVLSSALAHRPHVGFIGLSNNGLTDSSAQGLARIVRVHGVRRDEKYWTTSLRGRSPSVCGDGLQLLDISDNKLGNQTVQLLCESLVHDKWLVGINLRKNNVGPRGIVLFSELIQTNSTLCIIDLHENPESDIRLVHFLENLISKRCVNLDKQLDPFGSIGSYYAKVLIKWGIPRKLLRAFNVQPNDPFCEVAFDSSDEYSSSDSEKEISVKKKQPIAKNSSQTPEISSIARSNQETPEFVKRNRKKENLESIRSKRVDFTRQKYHKNSQRNKALKNRKSRLKKTQESNKVLESTESEDNNHESAIDVLVRDSKKLNDSSKSEEDNNAFSPDWARDLMERMKTMEQMQIDSKDKIQELQHENAQLKRELHQYRIQDTIRPPQYTLDKKVDYSTEELDIMKHLESSIVALSQQVGQLEQKRQDQSFSEQKSINAESKEVEVENEISENGGAVNDQFEERIESVLRQEWNLES